LGIRINAKCSRIQLDCKMQRLQQRHVLRNIVILMADPLCDSDYLAVGFSDDHADAGWAGAAVRSSVHIRYELRHAAPSEDTMRPLGCPVKSFVWYLRDCPFGSRSVESDVDNSSALYRHSATC